MKYVDFSDKPITSQKVILWRLWDALGDLNRARDEIGAALETSYEADINFPSLILSLNGLCAEIAERGKRVGKIIDVLERETQK